MDPTFLLASSLLVCCSGGRGRPGLIARGAEGCAEICLVYRRVRPGRSRAQVRVLAGQCCTYPSVGRIKAPLLPFISPFTLSLRAFCSSHPQVSVRCPQGKYRTTPKAEKDGQASMLFCKYGRAVRICLRSLPKALACVVRAGLGRWAAHKLPMIIRLPCPP